MTLIKGTVASLATTLALCTTAAHAQTTLGELLDKGFKKMMKGEFTSILVGQKWSGLTANEVRFENIYKADGSLSGWWWGSQGGQGGLTGNWRMDDEGKICAFVSSTWDASTTCYYFFHSGDQYYTSLSDSDRDARVRVRTVKK